MNDIVSIPIAEYERGRRSSARFVRTNTNAIMATEYPPIRWVVENYVPEGLSILAGRQKLGKTWLALDWAIAVASGGAAMGSIFCEVGDVLYIDLENGPRRIQGRINMLFPGERNRPDLSRLDWVNEAPDLNKGFIPALDDWRISVSDPRLVVIDVLQRIKPAGKAGQTSYESDYDAMSALQRWATEHRVGVLCLHHTRKGGADDPLEALSGSNGLSACADTTLLLDRDGNGITLYVRGRDVEEKESALNFLSGAWNLIGEAAEVRRTDERSRILSALLTADAPISPREIAVATGMPRNNVDQLLFKMGKAGELQKSGRGGYVHPDRRDLIKNPDKIDKKVRLGWGEPDE
ncbi:AAA family ATPase [Aquibium sp. LZ166]|uniref:AAA family ATPase n=1 Tax=Aquibium pacificus TaxID=3153579 RepID=A0ABV3SJ21_9HYPH